MPAEERLMKNFLFCPSDSSIFLELLNCPSDFISFRFQIGVLGGGGGGEGELFPSKHKSAARCLPLAARRLPLATRRPPSAIDQGSSKLSLLPKVTTSLLCAPWCLVTLHRRPPQICTSWSPAAVRFALMTTDGEQELNVNAALQTAIETCLLETVRGVDDVRLLFDMMAITLERLSSVKVVARAALASLFLLM
ncbi:hypothetical protein ACS0TY_033831 [Phlomoides rotata]